MRTRLCIRGGAVRIVAKDGVSNLSESGGDQRQACAWPKVPRGVIINKGGASVSSGCVLTESVKEEGGRAGELIRHLDAVVLFLSWTKGRKERCDGSPVKRELLVRAHEIGPAEIHFDFFGIQTRRRG